MNSSDIKKRVRRFRREFRIKDVTIKSLEEAFEEQGLSIVDFNPVHNDPDTTTVIENLGLSDMVLHTDAFLYVDNNYRLVFVNEKLNDQERLIVLAHEEGHYYCGHAFLKNTVGHNVLEEQEANEFAHYLLREGVIFNLRKIAAKHRKVLIIGAVITGLSFGGGVARKEYHDSMLYEGEFYVTTHGEKYHLKDCVTIEGHDTRRLTKEDVESGKYEPCSVCHPDR